MAVGKIARVDLLKIETRVADVQAQVISLADEREILAGQLNALLGRSVDTPVAVQQDLPSAALHRWPKKLATEAVSASTQYALAGAQLGAAQSSLACARTATPQALLSRNGIRSEF